MRAAVGNTSVATIAVAGCLIAILAVRRRRRTLQRNSQQSLRVITDEDEADECLRDWHRRYANGTLKPAIGLDAEWVRSSALPVALLQLCSTTGGCTTETLLLRLVSMSHAPPALLALLADASILKCGVGVGEDIHRVGAWATTTGASLTPDGVIELVPLARRAGFSSTGLASLSTEILQRTLAKEHSVRCSNWEAPTLSPEQCEYAANDARASLNLLLALHDRERASSRAPLSVWAASASVQPSGGTAPTEGRSRSSRSSHSGTHGGGGGGRSSTKPVRVPPRSKPLYDGWLMLGPDGVPMCRMATNRAEW